MKQLNVYLTFAGNCEEALNFYKNALRGEIISIQRFGDAPMPSPEEHKNKIMHSEFKAEELYFMASDGYPGFQSVAGNNVTLSINLTDEGEQDRIFNSLSEGGKIGMALQDTFWGARFGMLADKFGINWMLNCEKKK